MAHALDSAFARLGAILAVFALSSMCAAAALRFINHGAGLSKVSQGDRTMSNLNVNWALSF